MGVCSDLVREFGELDKKIERDVRLGELEIKIQYLNIEFKIAM